MKKATYQILLNQVTILTVLAELGKAAEVMNSEAYWPWSNIALRLNESVDLLKTPIKTKRNIVK